MKHILQRTMAMLLAMPLALAAQPLCEACPVDSGLAARAPAASHTADHACCDKKQQVKQAHTADHCDSCVGKPATANHSSELKADFHLSQNTQRALPDATPFVLPHSTRHAVIFHSHSPPAVYLVQQKILL